MIVLQIGRRGPGAPASQPRFVSTLILLSVPASALARRGARHLAGTAPIEPPALPPISLPDIELPGDAHIPIDWLAEAGRAAEAVTAVPQTRAFGRIPEAPSWLGSSRSAPAHQAGEQYRLETGESIVWVSDRCYLVSEPAPLGTPDMLARSLGTRMGCLAPSGPLPDELFKDLPAYTKYHPQ